MLSNSRLFLFILWVKVHFFEWSFLLNSLKTETSRSKILGVLILLFENICFVFRQGDAFKSCTIHYTNLHFNSVALENLSQIPLYLFSSPVPNAQMHKYSHGFLSNKEVGVCVEPKHQQIIHLAEKMGIKKHIYFCRSGRLGSLYNFKC